MQAETQRYQKLIMDYISSHQGCLAEDAMREFRRTGTMARATFFKHLVLLKGANKILEEESNKRDIGLYTNSNNPLVSVPKELDEFEKAYLDLLKYSVKRINQKDFSHAARELGIDQSDPSKWNESDMVNYSSFEFEKWKRALEIDRKNNDLYRKVLDIQEESLDRRRQLLDKTEVLLGKLRKKEILTYPIAEFDELDSLHEQEDVKLEMKPMRYSYNIGEFEISLLTHGAVAIFYLLRDTLFYRSILIWSNTISDKESLKKLYTIVYTRMANLQIHLVKFLSSPRVRLIANPIEYKNPVEFIILFTEILGKHTLSSLLLRYNEMGLMNLVEAIATSISNINKEIKEYGYSNPIFSQLEHAFEIIKRSEELDIKLEELKRKRKELQTDAATHRK